MYMTTSLEWARCDQLHLFHRFKQELSASLQREKSLEQSKAQLQLDWEGRMEKVERKAYGKHQNIIQQLTQAKDKVNALKIHK